MKKAIILLSGGLDSTTVATIAKKHYQLHALSFNYSQKNVVELKFAKKIVNNLQITEHKIIKIDLSVFGNSALTDNKISVPKNRSNIEEKSKIPTTYVPARNTIFLSLALAYAETTGAFDIFLGVNAIDYSGYPDCRSEFIASFEKMANLATANTGKISNKYKIHTPLINLDKGEIIKTGLNLGIDYSNTHSCYDPIIKKSKIYACRNCDSCILRLNGFKENNIKDPYPYFLD